MIYTLQNDCLTVQISDVGAELISCVSRADGCEYLWQRDPAYWDGTAPWLFPICSNLYQGKYTYRGKAYEMCQHGFASTSVFAAGSVSDTALTLTLTPNEQTRAVYPFEFAFSVTYQLSDNRLDCRLTVQNNGKEMMYATVGGHPGFNVPLAGEGEYTDYYLEFDEPCSPDEVVFTKEFCDSGKRRPYDLKDSKRFLLSHDLFRIDGVFLSGMSKRVTLRSDKARHGVTVSYGDAPYLGFWSSDNDGPYVCVEPWYGMASFDGVLPIEEKSNMFRLPAGAAKAVSMSITFH